MSITPEQLDQIKQADLANVLKKVKSGKTLTKGERELLDEAGETPRVLGMASNFKACAAQTGLPLQAVHAAKDNGCPAWKANGRIDCDVLVAWYAEHQDILEKFSKVPNIEVEKALLVRARRLDMEQRTAIRGEKLVTVAVIRRDVGKMILSAKGQLTSNVDSIVAGATMKCGLTPEQAADLRQIVHDHTHAALRELARGEWGKEEQAE